MASVKQTIGGTVFECVRPGLWVTPDHRHAIVEQMCNRVEHQWLFFRTNRHELSTDPIASPYDLEDADFWSGDMISWHFTMGELAHDVATEFLTSEQIESVQRALRGPLRGKSGDAVRAALDPPHRAILADCRAALRGDGGCRASVARAWLKINRVPAPPPTPNIPNIFDDLFPAKKES